MPQMRSAMQLKIENIPISELKLNETNPRLILDGDFKSLIASLKECLDLFKARPILASSRTGKNVIIAGNMRYRAAIELGMKEVPAIIFRDISEAQEIEILLKDNGSFGEWDFEKLKDEWGDEPLEKWGVELPEPFNQDIPEDNKDIDESEFENTKHECKECGFKW